MEPMTPTSPGIALYLTEIKVTDWPGMVHWYVANLGLRLTLEDAAHQYALLEAGAAAGAALSIGGEHARAPSSAA